MTSKHKSKTESKLQGKDLVKAGPRAVFIDSDKARKLREDKPTTSRALVLRNAKLALQGNVDPASKQRISGREKLDLLAEDIVEQTTKAVAAPFDILKCLRIAESQYDASLGEIAYLRDPHMFSIIIDAEINAQTRYDPKKPDPLKNPSYVARMVGTKIHNQHMLASAWKIIGNILRELIDRGMSNKNVKALLKNDNRIRSLYFALFRMAEVMVDINQQRFSSLALNSAHYARYFKQQQSDDPVDEPIIIFDHSELREAGLSFIDSIIIELCFPQAPYPKFVLYQILHDAAEESPRETKRFSQLMWDAVGDLSECVEMQQLLEAPLLIPEANEWKEEMWQMPQEFDTWRDAQMMSLKASEEIANIQDVVFPLTKTFRKAVLDSLWIRIDQNYFRLTGKGIDELWKLKGERDFEPRWTSFYMCIPKKNMKMSGSDNEDGREGRKKTKEPLAIADWPANGPDYEDMPELQTVSNSSDDYSSDDEAASEASFVDSESEDDDGFDTEEEGVIKRLVREAVDCAIEGDLFNKGDPRSGPVKVDDERLNNPFLNLLTSLRGRLFRRDPKLHAPSKLPTHAGPTYRKKAAPFTEEATIEEATDEEESTVPSKKKKKKPKKKKRLASITSADQVSLSSAPAPAFPVPPEIKSPPVSSTIGKAKKAPASLVSNARPATQAISAAALPTFETATTKVESARAYLSSLEPQKAKSKTRSDQASIFSKDDESKAASGGIGSSIMSKLGFGKKKPIMEPKEQRMAQKSWFSRLSTRAAASMHHLLNTSSDVKQGKGGMKWDDFVKLMAEMGFQCDPSTAGSSVRFTPPGNDDHPISIHKPHPKAYLTPWHLKCISKRLKDRYGWDEDIFMSQAVSVSSSDSEKD